MSLLKLSPLLVTLLLMRTAAQPQESGCDKEPKISPYIVTGTTAEELENSILSNGPVDEQGVRRYAYTAWKVSWSWPFDTEGKPEFEKSTLTCNVNIMIPKWDPPSNVDTQLRKRWEQLSAAILSHEMNHANKALERAPRIIDNIKAAREANPNFAWDDANRVGFMTLRTIRDLDRSYDLKTKHGKLEGISTQVLFGK